MGLPEQSRADRALAIGRALLADIVPGGGTLAELAGQFIRTPYERRIQEWGTQVGDALARLESGLKSVAGAQARTLEDLQADQAFVDTVLHATQVALRNANEEKRAALRNAIANAGLPAAPDESQRLMFLHYIDSFTHWHLRLLGLFNDPPKWFEAHGKPWLNLVMGGRWHVLEAAYPEARGDEPFFNQVWRDLHISGLVTTDSLSGSMSANGLRQSATTVAGQRSVTFISDPAGAVSA